MFLFLSMLRKLPASFYLTALAVIVIAGGLFLWTRHVVSLERDRQASERLEAENKAYEQKIEEMRQYTLFLENSKNKNAEYAKRQKKAAKNDDEDGPVAPALRNGLERLRNYEGGD